jgi:hypothetical protein
MAYKDHRGRFVSKDVYEWLQREKAAHDRRQRKKGPRKDGLDYPEKFVDEQLKIRKRRAKREDFKRTTKAGHKGGVARTLKSEALHELGIVSEPVIIEHTKTFTTKIWLFEGLEGEQATLHVLDLYEDIEPDATTVVAIEMRAPRVKPQRIGSPYGSIKQTKFWVIGASERKSHKAGQPSMFDEFDNIPGARLIWELEIKTKVKKKRKYKRAR